MKFTDSDLLDHKVVREAFEYSQANVLARKSEIIEKIMEQLDMGYQRGLENLEFDKQDKLVTEDQYNKEKKDLERQYNEQIRLLPLMAEKQIEIMFARNRVSPALDIQQNSENPSPELIAAMMLIDCVRSPIDYQNVVKKFGKGIGGIIADVSHLDAYPSEYESNAAKADADVKRVCMARMLTGLAQIVFQAKILSQQKPPQKLMFATGQEKILYEEAKVFWGNDKKLDNKFINSFNQAAQAAGSQYKMEIGIDGGLLLIKDNLSPPPNSIKKPIKPGKSGPVIGDDIF